MHVQQMYIIIIVALYMFRPFEVIARLRKVQETAK